MYIVQKVIRLRAVETPAFRPSGRTSFSVQLTRDSAHGKGITLRDHGVLTILASSSSSNHHYSDHEFHHPHGDVDGKTGIRANILTGCKKLNTTYTVFRASRVTLEK